MEALRSCDQPSGCGARGAHPGKRQIASTARHHRKAPDFGNACTFQKLVRLDFLQQRLGADERLPAAEPMHRSSAPSSALGGLRCNHSR
jgi:hypothetical protein